MGFRPYILADLNTGYTYEMKLLKPIEEKQNKTKMYSLITEFMNELTLKSKKKHILSTDGLYSSEELLDCKYSYSRHMFIISNFLNISEEAMRTRWSKKIKNI